MSLWWKWLAAGGNVGKVPQSWATEELELELGLQLEPEPELELELDLGMGLELEQEKREQRCGLQRCSGLHHHLHWLPEEAVGLTWLSVSGKRRLHMFMKCSCKERKATFIHSFCKHD